jgi:hypothetical protein
VARTGLTCELHLDPAGPGLVGVRFQVSNPGNAPVAVSYYEPFVDFDLSARTDQSDLPIVQPAYSLAAQQVESIIQSDETVTIQTPIRITFDPTIPPSGGPDPTTWTIPYGPTTVHLTAVVRLRGTKLPPCHAVLGPEHLNGGERGSALG